MDPLVEKVLAGNIRAVARLIRDIDDGLPGVRSCLKELYPHTGRAYVIGVTGSPGVGKSTLVDRMLGHLRARNQTVGVLAIDPTSPFSGGAILGDRIRMQRHSLDEGVYVRSLATRGYFGGLSQSTRSAVDVLDAMGRDYIIVETVGVGQDEVDVAGMAHSTIVVVVPGMGDEIQAIKAGILEVADIFVINKADRPGVEKTRGELELMLDLNKDKYQQGAWRPPILTTRANLDEGIDALMERVEDHAAYLRRSSGTTPGRRGEARVRRELSEMVKNMLVQRVLEQLQSNGRFEEAVKAIVNQELDPYTACEELINSALNADREG